ncbi:MAG: hypothetical protein ACFFFH_12750 [Candidatus Thorarchaeota archaeon]
MPDEDQDQYRKIIADGIQRKIIDDFAAIISENISIQQRIIKGFLWRALRKWQENHEMTILDTERGVGSTPEERIKQASEILDLCYKDMEYSASDELEGLKTGINKALQHYIRKYSER